MTRPTPDHDARCAGCWLLERGCVCDRLRTRRPNAVHIAIICHVLEQKKVSNTGRFAAAALQDSSLHRFGDPLHPLDPALFERPDTWLLYPEGPAAEPPPSPPGQLIVLDGTWHQARRMRQRITALRGLPVLSLPPPTQPRQRMRRAPDGGAMSTLEAIAAALRFLGEPDVATHLDDLHEHIVRSAQLPGRRRLTAS